MNTRSTKIRIATNYALAAIFLIGCTFSSARADAVSDWNAIAVQSVVTAGATRPGASGTLDIATVHAAIYDAVQAIEGDFDPYYRDIPGATGDPRAATAKAARDVLVNRFPLQAAAIDTTYQNYLLMHGIPANDPGIAVGATAAARIIEHRSCDGSFPTNPTPFTGGTGLYVWRPTPPANLPMTPGPWQGFVTPFTLTRPSQFRSDPPPDITGRQYARDYNEVKAVGGALGTGSRTPAQTDQGFFWAGNYVVMMNAVVRQMADAHVDEISDNSRLFALTSMAMADAIINCWNDKVTYVSWRPITAIQNGDIDGNSRTTGDPAWTSLVPAPPYPDQSSGANSITAATMRGLRNFFRRDRKDFSVTTTNTGPTNQDVREFERFSDAAQEVVDGRIFLGFHFRFADEDARTLGFRVADWAYENYFQRVGHGHGHGDDDLMDDSN